MIAINSIELSKNPVSVNESFIIRVEIGTWDNMKANFTWDSLKNSGLTWDTLKARGEK